MNHEDSLALADRDNPKHYCFLPPRLAYILVHRNLAERGRRPTSLEELARRLKISRERVRQLEAVAHRRLRWHAHPCELETRDG